MKHRSIFSIPGIMIFMSLVMGITREETFAEQPFNYIADRFADIQLLRYNIHGFDSLTLQQKKLAYYLSEAGLCGRDIFYNQKDKNGVMIRKTLETILNTYSGDKKTEDWNKFLTYCKRFFFANGVHHHYSSDKMIPECSFEYFSTLLKNCDQTRLPFEANDKPEVLNYYKRMIFDPKYNAKVVDLSAYDVIQASSNNFYENVSQQEVEQYYKELKDKQPNNKSQIGFNTKLIKEDGKMKELVWRSGEMYGAAIDKILFWLEKALAVAENEMQRQSIQKLIDFYKTGDPVKFDEYSISWVKDSLSTIDVVNGFIEGYQDALGRKCSYESIVSMRDKEASKKINAIAHEAQWFENNSPIMNEHKKKEVKGIRAKVITIINEVGDAAPSTPIGINLPNNEWIREDIGSKSVSLSNIIEAYDYYKAKSPMIDEFSLSEDVKTRVRKYGSLCGILHTEMHEVIGHASGKINEGVKTMDETLKNYSGVLEETRADLVALYYIMDQKLIDIGVMPSLEVGMAQYDLYILNGLMTQLQRIEPGKNLEEAHMRNRQLISQWVFEKGKAENVIEKKTINNKTYFVINDYKKVRELMGKLLREVQRIKSEGDFDAGKNLVETYGVNVNQPLLKEVHDRYKKLDIAPYLGFIQPKLIPVMEGENISDVKVEYPDSFIDQMLEYGAKYSFLQITN